MCVRLARSTHEEKPLLNGILSRPTWSHFASLTLEPIPKLPLSSRSALFVITAQAGIQVLLAVLDARFRGHDLFFKAHLL
jgi:hypothetical protein